VYKPVVSVPRTACGQQAHERHKLEAFFFQGRTPNRSREWHYLKVSRILPPEPVGGLCFGPSFDTLLKLPNSQQEPSSRWCDVCCRSRWASESASVSVLVTSITENRTPPTDGIAIDDALTVDSEVGSAVAQAVEELAWRRCKPDTNLPPPPSPPLALLPCPFAPGSWGVSLIPLEGQPLGTPEPLRLTALPPSVSQRLSCSSMPFLKR
jgi:hypothetical protein